jgi:hypothetical protein
MKTSAFLHPIKKYWSQIFLLLAVFFFLFKILFAGEIFITPGLGLSDYNLNIVPNAHFLTEALKQGRLPLWVPEIWAGFPLIASGESSPLYPLNLILFSLFSPAAGLALYALFAFLMIGFSTFYFLKSLKLSSEASLVAALSFTFASGIVVRMVHIQFFGTIAFFPLTLLLTEYFFKKKNPLFLLLLGLVLALQILNFTPPIALICFLGFSFYFLFKAYFSSSRKQLPVNLLALFLTLLLAFLLAAVQILPGFQLLEVSERKTGISLERTLEFPFCPQELLYFLRPAPFGSPSTGNYNTPCLEEPSAIWESNTYTGLVALALGVLALFYLATKKKEVLFFSSLLIFSLILALGRYTPFSFLLELPPFSFFRVPGRFLILTMFSLSVLAAYGFDVLFHRLQGDTYRRRSAEGGVAQPRMKSPPGETSIKKIAKYRSPIAFFVALLILVDLFSFGLFYNPTYQAQKWLSPPQTAQFLTKDKSFFRIYTLGYYDAYYQVYRQYRGWKNLEPYFNLRESLPPNFGVLSGLNHADGYTALPPERFTQWEKTLQQGIQFNSHEQTSQISELGLKMLRLKNVKYLISPHQLLNKDLVLKKEIRFDENQPHYFIYQLENPLPHAFIVHQARRVGNKEEMFEAIGQENFDPQKTILLEEGFEDLPEKFPPGEDKVEISQYLPEKVVVQASSKNPGFLLLTDNNLFGWQAVVNGQPTKIFQANYLFRAVRIEPGENEIVFTYQLKSLYYGALISLATFFLSLALICFFLLKPRIARLK